MRREASRKIGAWFLDLSRVRGSPDFRSGRFTAVRVANLPTLPERPPVSRSPQFHNLLGNSCLM